MGVGLIQSTKGLRRKRLTFPQVRRNSASRWPSDLSFNLRFQPQVGSVLELGRSARGGYGDPFQYSCMENSLHRRAWWATVHSVAKSQTRQSNLAHARAHTAVWRALLLDNGDGGASPAICPWLAWTLSRCWIGGSALRSLRLWWLAWAWSARLCLEP